MLKHTGSVFFTPRTRVGSSILTDVRFSEQRRPVCVKHLLNDVKRAVAVAPKIENNQQLKYLTEVEVQGPEWGV